MLDFQGCVLLLVLNLACSHVVAIGFTDAPGTVRVHEEDTANMRWTLNLTLGSSGWTKINYLFQGNTIYTRTGLGESWQDDYKGRATPVYDDTSRILGFNLNNIQSTDLIGKFTCKITVGGVSFANNDSELFMFGTPLQPDITTDLHAILGNPFDLMCDASSDSEPIALAPPMKYTWLREGNVPDDVRHTISGTDGETLTIKKLSAIDNSTTYTCTAHEEGSNLNNTVENSIKLSDIDHVLGEKCSLKLNRKFKTLDSARIRYERGMDNTDAGVSCEQIPNIIPELQPNRIVLHIKENPDQCSDLTGSLCHSINCSYPSDDLCIIQNVTLSDGSQIVTDFTLDYNEAIVTLPINITEPNCMNNDACIIPATVVPICCCAAIGFGVGFGLKNREKRKKMSRPTYE